MEEEMELPEDDFSEFLKNNMSILSEVLDERDIKLSVADFAKLHSIFMNVDAAIISAVDVCLSEQSSRADALEKFRKTVLSNKKELDEYFSYVLLSHTARREQ